MAAPWPSGASRTPGSVSRSENQACGEGSKDNARRGLWAKKPISQAEIAETSTRPLRVAARIASRLAADMGCCSSSQIEAQVSSRTTWVSEGAFPGFRFGDVLQHRLGQIDAR